MTPVKVSHRELFRSKPLPRDRREPGVCHAPKMETRGTPTVRDLKAHMEDHIKHLEKALRDAQERLEKLS